MDLGISGKVAVVAASSKGLGRAIAQELAEAGGAVVMNGRTPAAVQAAADQIARDTGAPTQPVPSDVSTDAGCRSLIDAATARFGRVDILITNSGGPQAGSFDTLDDRAWGDAIDVTLLNVVRLIRLALPTMKRQRWGRVVNVTSLAARQPIEGLMLSNALRAAVHGMAKTLSREVARNGVLVNNVCPGMHATDRLTHLAHVRATAAGTSVEQEHARMAQAIPLGRLGDPRELAAAVAFLCSKRASFITGQSLIVDGGASTFLT